MLIFMIGISFPTLSQDIIILKTGDELQSIVHEIDIDVIKYKKFENQEGPLYTIEKSKVFMIKYANGTKDVFNDQPLVQDNEPITPEAIPPDTIPHFLVYKMGIKMDNKSLSDGEIQSIFSDYPDPMKYYTQGEILKLTGSVFQWSVIGVGIYTIFKGRPLDPPESEELAKKGVIAMGGLAVGWLTLNIIGNSRKKKAVDTYNSQIAKPSSYNFQLFMQDNQVGLAMRF